MKQITVKIPDKLEKSFNDLVRIEFGGNVNQAVVSILAGRLGLAENGIEERLEVLEKSMAKILKWFKEQRIEI